MTDLLDVINNMSVRLTCEIGLDTFYKKGKLSILFQESQKLNKATGFFVCLVFPHFLVTVTAALILRVWLCFFVRCSMDSKSANAHTFPFELVKSSECAFEKALVSWLGLAWPLLRLGLH